MKRILFLVLGAMGIIFLGIAFLLIFEPGTLAKETLRVGDAKITFRIEERDGMLYVSAHERRSWSHGFQSTHWIGEKRQIGTETARIFLDDKRGVVVLLVGKARLEFDPQRQSFRTSAAAP